LALGRQGRHQESIPYFREVVREDPRSGIAHENLASALGNGAQQVRTHLGKTDNANRSSVERIAMLKETIAETESARQLARTDQERVYYLLEQGRTLYTWGFPIDALDRMRAAYEIAPGNPTVERSFHGLEHELATGKRP
jgi:tetratricopeptide (TPR) repeat protein